MSEREQFDAMVEDFARAVGRTFERDGDGLWTIMAGGVPVHGVYEEKTGLVVTFVRIGEMMTEQYSETWARGLLEAHAFWGESRGFTFALDPETGSLVVHDRRPLSYFPTAEHLAGYVNGLVELVGETVRQLTDLEDAMETEA